MGNTRLIIIPIKNGLDQKEITTVLSAYNYLWEPETRLLLVGDVDPTEEAKAKLFTFMPRDMVQFANLPDSDIEEQLPNLTSKLVGKHVTMADLKESLIPIVFAKINPDVNFVWVNRNNILVGKPNFKKNKFNFFMDANVSEVSNQVFEIPAGFASVKERLVLTLENDLLDKYVVTEELINSTLLNTFFLRNEELVGAPTNIIKEKLVTFAKHEISKDFRKKDAVTIMVDLPSYQPFLTVKTDEIDEEVKNTPFDQLVLNLLISVENEPNFVATWEFKK